MVVRSRRIRVYPKGDLMSQPGFMAIYIGLTNVGGLPGQCDETSASVKLVIRSHLETRPRNIENGVLVCPYACTHACFSHLPLHERT